MAARKDNAGTSQRLYKKKGSAGYPSFLAENKRRRGPGRSMRAKGLIYLGEGIVGKEIRVAVKQRKKKKATPRSPITGNQNKKREQGQTNRTLNLLTWGEEVAEGEWLEPTKSNQKKNKPLMPARYGRTNRKGRKQCRDENTLHNTLTDVGGRHSTLRFKKNRGI